MAYSICEAYGVELGLSTPDRLIKASLVKWQYCLVAVTTD